MKYERHYGGDNSASSGALPAMSLAAGPCAESATVGINSRPPLGSVHVREYVRNMAATLTSSMRQTLPAAAAGATGVDMSFTICADLSLIAVNSGVDSSG